MYADGLDELAELLAAAAAAAAADGWIPKGKSEPKLGLIPNIPAGNDIED